MTERATVVAGSQDLSRMARGGTANLVGAAVTAVCTFGLTVAVARGVSREAAGVFFSVTSLFLVATVLGQLGTQTALVFFVAKCRAQRDVARGDDYLRAALRAILAVALVMTVGVLVFAEPIAETIAPQHAGAATTYLRVLAPFIPAAGWEAALLSASRVLGSMRANVIIEQVGRPLAQLVLVALATVTTSVWVLGLAWSIGYLPAAVASAWAWRVLRAKYPHGPRRPRPERVTQSLWKFSLPRALTSVLQMLMQRFDIVLVGALAGAVDAAIYAAATRFIVVGQLGTNALTSAAQPQLATRLATGDRDGARELYQTSTAWLILVTWPMYLTMIIFGKPLLLVFGHGYTSGQTTIVLIASSMLISTGLGIVDTVLSMAGRTSANLGNAALALAVNIGLDFWLIPRHGIVGAAIGWAVAIVVRNVAAVLQVGLRLHISPFAVSAASAAALNTVCYFVILGAARIAFGNTPLAMLSGLVVATVVYAGAVWLLRGPLRLDALRGLRRTRALPASADVQSVHAGEG